MSLNFSLFRFKHLCALIFGATLILFSKSSYSSTYYGRTSIGSAVIKERFSNDYSGSDSNDFASSIGRLFFLQRDGFTNKDEFSFDIRDRYSLYDQLNKENLSLGARNIFQVTKFYYKQNPNWGSWTLGRKPIIDAGGVYVDGVNLEIPINNQWLMGTFGGLNPKRSDQSQVVGNKDSTIGGVYFTYQPRFLKWGKNLFISNGIVSESVRTQEDRRFFTQSINYQWGPEGQLVESLYLDFIPRTYIQTGSLVWNQNWNSNWSTHASLLGIDVIEYTRRQGLRERLTASPYKEAELNTTLKTTSVFSMELGGASGERSADRLKKTDAYLKLKTNKQYLNKQLVELKIGSRKNFTSQDQYTQGSWSYYDDHWEFSLDLEKTKEKYDDGTILNGTQIASNLIYLTSKSLFLSGSFEYAADENVKIYSTFIRLNYRFGNTELPPLRDGAPPASRL